ncbi:MAG: hypothetical protein JXB32_21550, partial [Deltaproteobacteria bacterium]|nr:hypothetical protein [Deltaproteobacteria bacterium]
ALALLRDLHLGARAHDVVSVLRGDAVWLAGREAEARVEYEAVLPRVTRAAERRLLLAKLHLLARPAAAELLRDYLLQFSRPGRSPETFERDWIAQLEEAARRMPEDAVVTYLLGRARYNALEHGPAEEHLRASLALGLAPDELRLEALALLVNLQYRRGAWDGAAREARTLAGSGNDEYRAQGEDWLERIAWRRAR